MHERSHQIDTFPWNEADAARDYAESIGGTVESIAANPELTGLRRIGFHAISHPRAEGLTVSRWEGNTLPSQGTLVRRDSLLPGDVVYAGGKVGVQTVSEVMYDGRETGFVRYARPYPDLFSADASSLIPLLFRNLGAGEVQQLLAG